MSSRAEAMTIPEMNKRLEQMNTFFVDRTQHFNRKIRLHEGRFNPEDGQEFEVLINEIKVYAMDKINAFFQSKMSVKTACYDQYVSQYNKDGSFIENDLDQFRIMLEKATIAMKQEQNRKQNLMEHLSTKFARNMLLKRAFKAFKDNERQRKLQRAQDQRMDMIYAKNLMKKSFFPWRTLTYKDGFANTVRRETQKDIMTIHAQYQSIVDILKRKISETEEIIKVKKAAKGEFAYALSKNLLKTISNLSLEVMSLNQMSLRDGQWDQDSTVKFMDQVDQVIKQKLSKVREYRRGLVQEVENEEQVNERTDKQDKKKKHISFA